LENGSIATSLTLLCRGSNKSCPLGLGLGEALCVQAQCSGHGRHSVVVAVLPGHLEI
jgi:hypothetical protein